jgi:hypothetical protein
MSGEVWTYSGSTYAEQPRALRWEGQRLEINAVLDRWQSPGSKGFHVRSEDGRVFRLVYDEVSEEWDVNLITTSHSKEST